MLSAIEAGDAAEAQRLMRLHWCAVSASQVERVRSQYRSLRQLLLTLPPEVPSV
jgi:DNA-binding GntR family transcriptional regulator